MITNPTKEDAISTIQTEDWLASWKQHFKETYPKGYVIYEGEINRYDDSQFYEILWLDDKQEVQRVDTGGTNFAYPSHSSHLPKMWDAPNEVQQKFRDFAIKQALDVERRFQLGCAIKFTETVARGSKVAVSKDCKSQGTLLSAGEEGTVFWVGQDKYSGGERLGIELDDGRKVFVNGSKVILIHTWKVSNDRLEHHMEEFEDGLLQAEWHQLTPWVIGRPHTSKDLVAWRGEVFCVPIGTASAE